MLCSFQYMSYTPLVKFVTKYFILLDVVANKIFLVLFTTKFLSFLNFIFKLFLVSV